MVAQTRNIRTLTAVKSEKVKIQKAQRCRWLEAKLSE
jgi:hypothetical protein